MGFKLIMGPCAIESKDFLLDAAGQIHKQFVEYYDDFDHDWSFDRVENAGIDYYFKSSFDKANRTSINSFRGVGLEKGLEALQAVKNEFGFKLLTDIHEAHQAEPVAEVVDVIQIPAFLCRQTDLIVAAAKTGKIVNIKKGQQMPASAMKHSVQKYLDSAPKPVWHDNVWLTERGTFFGYGDVVVDMRNLYTMAQWSPVIFDATHSVQQPGGADGTTGGNREMVLPLLGSALAMGIDGAFLETHPNPPEAKSDAGSQLYIEEIPQILDMIYDQEHSF